MSEKIEPVLKSDEWDTIARSDGVTLPDFDGDITIGFAHDRDEEGRGIIVGRGDAYLPATVRAVIAIANAALPESDPRKITRERIGDLRTAAGQMPSKLGDRMTAFADALESYLPPEKG